MSSPPSIDLYTGDNTTLPVAVTEDGSAYDITGHTLSWMISASKDGDALLQLDVTEHSNPTGGISALTISAANLVTIGGAGKYWLHGVDVDGDGGEVTWVIARLIVYDRPQRA